MDFFFTIAALALVLELVQYYATGRDSSDMPKTKWYDGGESCLRVYVDNATGVHYVKAGVFSKLRVRINADGTPYTGE